MADEPKKKRKEVVIFNNRSGAYETHAEDPADATFVEDIQEAFLPSSAAVDLKILRKRKKSSDD